jgi:hypothetical protein
MKSGRAAPRARRAFAVEAYAGRKIAGWPLGRLDVGTDGLRVRLLFPEAPTGRLKAG